MAMKKNMLLPVSFLQDDYELIEQINPKAFIVKAIAGGKPGWLIDAIYDFRFQTELYKNIWENATVKQDGGQYQLSPG